MVFPIEEGKPNYRDGDIPYVHFLILCNMHWSSPLIDRKQADVNSQWLCFSEHVSDDARTRSHCSRYVVTRELSSSNLLTYHFFSWTNSIRLYSDGT